VHRGLREGHRGGSLSKFSLPTMFPLCFSDPYILFLSFVQITNSSRKPWDDLVPPTKRKVISLPPSSTTRSPFRSIAHPISSISCVRLSVSRQRKTVRPTSTQKRVRLLEKMGIPSLKRVTSLVLSMTTQRALSATLLIQEGTITARLLI